MLTSPHSTSSDFRSTLKNTVCQGSLLLLLLLCVCVLTPSPLSAGSSSKTNCRLFLSPSLSDSEDFASPGATSRRGGRRRAHFFSPLLLLLVPLLPSSSLYHPRKTHRQTRGAQTPLPAAAGAHRAFHFTKFIQCVSLGARRGGSDIPAAPENTNFIFFHL